MSKTIDLNCDMGESFGAWEMGTDAALMDVVSSINVACGFHAGDASTIRKTIETAINKGVAIGAHPSFPDLQGFGRREMSLSAQEIFDIVLYQVASLKGICEAYGTKLHHVKPHGALYNLAAKNSEIARPIAEAVYKIDSNLIFYGLAESCLISEAKSIGLKTANEVFADRTYQSDGTLTPRSEPNSLIESTEQSCKQIMQMIQDNAVTTTDGDKFPLHAETICIHGDGKHALEFAIAIRSALTKNGFSVAVAHQ